MQVFAKALGLTEAELFKQMETGKVLAAETLPKVAKAYRDAAKEGGAYELALKGLRVAEGRMLTDAQRAGKNIFQGGFSEGMAKMYESITNMLKSSEPQLKKLGKVFGMVFEAIAKAIDIVTPVLKLFIDNLEVLVGAAMLGKVHAMTAGFTAMGLAGATAWARILAPITAVIAALGVVDDYMADFDENKISVKEKAQGYQVINNRRESIEEKDGKYFRGKDIGEGSFFEQLFSLDNTEDMKRVLENKERVAAGQPIKDAAPWWKEHTNGISEDKLRSFADPMQYMKPTTTNTTTTVENKVTVAVDLTGVPKDDVPQKIATDIERGFNSFMNNGMVPQTR